MKEIVWTDYMKYRSSTREIDLDIVEEIVRYSTERYVDNETHRLIAVGKHMNTSVAVAYEESDAAVTPIAVHVTTRQQVNFRIRTGRYSHA